MWRLMPVLLLAFAVPAFSASLIDLGQGSFPHWHNTHFLDSAAHGWFDTPTGKVFLNGWVSQYGVLDGGKYFHTDLFDVSPTSRAAIWWDFAGSLYSASDSWALYFVQVFGRDTNGNSEYRNYQVKETALVSSPGRQAVELRDGFAVMSIAFYGGPASVQVPEPSTLAMLPFALGLLGLAAARIKRPPQP